MFEAPEIIKNIPDIKQIYDINEMQGDTLDRKLDDMCAGAYDIVIDRINQ